MKIKQRIIGVVVGMLLAVAAQAMSLADAKAAGYVGEQTDGYLGIVSSASSVQSLVSTVNSKRRAEYQRIAKANNISVAEVAKITARKVIGKAASGHYVQDIRGNWVQR